MASLEYRVDHAKRLREMRDKLYPLNGSLPSLPDLELDTDTPSKEKLEEDIKVLTEKIEQRLERVESPSCRIAVIGLEKQGKSTFVNAWLGKQALPSDTKRCTWATSTVVNGMTYRAEVKFASRKTFDDTVDGLLKALNVSRADIKFPLNIRDMEEMRGKEGNPAFKDLEQLSRFWHEINQNLGRAPLTIQPATDSIKDLNTELFKYLSLRSKESGEEQGVAYAVEHVDIHIPLAGKDLEFAIDDLPGIDAPGNRAEKMTWFSVERKADVIVLVKNAFNNASLNSNEERIWDKAQQSDSSIKMTDRLFVILNQADAEKIENGRDCHRMAYDNFCTKGVSKDRIFFCSSRAELYKDREGEDLSFPYGDDEFEKAINKIGNYRGQAEGTTGFPEFKNAIYRFLETDFPVLEKRALHDLIDEYNQAVQKIHRLLEAYQNSTTAEPKLSVREQERFAELWHSSAEQKKNIAGLRDAILKTVNALIRDVDERAEVSDNFLKGIRSTMGESKKHFLDTISLEAFNEMDLTGQASALQDLTQMELDYYKKTQGALKTVINSELAADISRNMLGHVRSIWEKAATAASPEAEKGLSAVSPDLMKEALLKELKKRPKPVFGQIFLDDASESVTSYGFAALLKSVAQAPAEYLFQTAEKHDANRARLLRKALIYQNGVSSDSVSKEVEKVFSENGQFSSVDLNNAFGEKVQNNLRLVGEMVGFFLPASFNTLVSRILKTADTSKGNTKKENPFAGTASTQKENTFNIFGRNTPVQEREKTAESVVEELKKRVEVFYVILEALLFDSDFGFLGYYRAVLEEFRRAVEEEMNEHGVIRRFAASKRREIWNQEPLFKENDERQRQEQLITRIRQMLT
jgi:GTPase SAR1 family protein